MAGVGAGLISLHPHPIRPGPASSWPWSSVGVARRFTGEGPGGRDLHQVSRSEIGDHHAAHHVAAAVATSADGSAHVMGTMTANMGGLPRKRARFRSPPTDPSQFVQTALALPDATDDLVPVAVLPTSKALVISMIHVDTWINPKGDWANRTSPFHLAWVFQPVTRCAPGPTPF
jgi:hypothetical protein